MRIAPHDRFASQVTLSPEQVSEFARLAGDLNPLHHDADFAAEAGFSTLVASGTQTTSLLMGLTATHFSRTTSMVGLDFRFRFRRAVLACDPLTLEWLVVGVREHERLGGRLVELRGRILDGAGETAVGAEGLVLVKEERRTVDRSRTT